MMMVMVGLLVLVVCIMLFGVDCIYWDVVVVKFVVILLVNWSGLLNRCVIVFFFGLV